MSLTENKHRGSAHAIEWRILSRLMVTLLVRHAIDLDDYWEFGRELEVWQVRGRQTVLTFSAEERRAVVSPRHSSALCIVFVQLELR